MNLSDDDMNIFGGVDGETTKSYSPPVIPVVLEETRFIFVSAGGVETKIVYKWRRDEFLAAGGMAKVYVLVNEETGEKCAGKIIPKTLLRRKKYRNHLRDEIRIHRTLQHDNIVQFISYFEVPNFFVILLELCEQKCMKELLKTQKRLTEDESRGYMTQIISAVKYIHSQNIIHRDLKLGNIFLTSGPPSGAQVKIGDFGLAAKLSHDDERRRTICGTPNYISPEVLNPGEVGYSFSADIWGLGVILYTFLVGRPPFETSDVKTTYRRIGDAIYYFPPSVEISDNAKSLVNALLKKHPHERPTLDEILQHPFFGPHFLPDTRDHV